MFVILPLNQDQIKYLKTRDLFGKWTKAKRLLENDLNHPSLNFEKIILKSNTIYSFRLDLKYRGLCYFIDINTIEIFAFTNHYK